MCLYSICLVSTTCCDTTITKHKHSTNIQELRTLLNPLLLLCIAHHTRKWKSTSSYVVINDPDVRYIVSVIYFKGNSCQSCTKVTNSAIGHAMPLGFFSYRVWLTWHKMMFGDRGWRILEPKYMVFSQIL